MVLLRGPCHIIREHQRKGKGIQEVLIVTLIGAKAWKICALPSPFCCSRIMSNKTWYRSMWLTATTYSNTRGPPDDLNSERPWMITPLPSQSSLTVLNSELKLWCTLYIWRFERKQAALDGYRGLQVVFSMTARQLAQIRATNSV